MSTKNFIAYVVMQYIGAIAGAAVLLALIGKSKGLGANGLFENNLWKSLLIEIILTFVFCLAVLGATSKPENSKVAGLVIGGSLTLVHLLGF